MKSRRIRNLTLMMTAPLLFFILFYLLLILPPRIYNDWKMNAFLNSMEALTLPQDSTLIESRSQFGILGGASNHCDAQVLLLVESSMEPRDFSSYFEGEVNLSLPYSEADRSFISVYYIDEGDLFQVNGEEWTMITDMAYSDAYSKQNLMNLPSEFTATEGKNLYLLTAWDQTFEGYAMNDLRCH